MQVLEKTVERKFLALCKARNWATIKLSTAGAMGASGWPDRLVIGPAGLSCYVELKRPGEASKPNSGLSDLQRQRQRVLRDRGHFVGTFDDAAKAVAWCAHIFKKYYIAES